MATPQVVSIVLNWNQPALTLECVESLRQLHGVARHQILVVDNGSTDDSVSLINAAAPDVELIELGENMGFAAGANVGVNRARELGAEWTLLVNNDAVVASDMLDKLLVAGQSPAVGLVVPTIYYYDTPDRVWPSAGWRRPWTLAAFDTSARPPSREPYDVDWAAACVLLVRAAVWESIGLLDERFFFYYEDHDLSLRALKAGWRIVHVPEASARHRVAGSTGLGSPRQRYLLGRSSVPFYIEHTSGPRRIWIVAYRVASLVKTLVLEALRFRWAEAGAYLHGLRDGWQDLRTVRR